MAKIDTRGSATLHLTDDEFGGVRERVQSLAPDSELARVLAEAQPTESPMVEPVPGPVEGEGVLVTYTYAITLPLECVQLAEDALRQEGNVAAADDVAAYEPPVVADPSPISSASLVMP